MRVPTIPGFNASEEDIRGIAEFVKESMPNVHEVHLLPYHNYGQGKYELLGREYELEKTPKIPEEEMENIKNCRIKRFNLYYWWLGGTMDTALLEKVMGQVSEELGIKNPKETTKRL